MAAVLVIEDETSLRQVFVRMLAGEGHRVTEARDGQEALRLLRSLEPQIILTDIVMPNVDGFEVIAANRRRAHPAKIIAMSGVSGFGPDYLKTALELGADYALEKPFRAAELYETILACLGAAASPEARCA
jgi:CheY-like chemotaxis protein